MRLSDFTGKPCRNKMAYEFLPNKKTNIDLGKAVQEIGKRFNIEVETKVLLMIRVNDKTVSLFPSGKLLVRGEKEENAARKIAEQIIELLN